jgi:Glycine rich protein
MTTGRVLGSGPLAAPVTRRFGRWWLAVAFLPPLGLAGVLGIGQARAALPSNCDQSGIKVSCQFSFTGADQTFTVPAGTSSVDIVAVGAPGGASGPRFPSPVPGGAGALARGTLKVTGGQVLHVEVGGPGDDGFTTSVGGFNGGGMGDPRRSSGPGGGGGGGASDVRTAPYSAEPGADTRLLVAAGGGGAGAPTPAFRDIPGYYVGGAGGAAGQPGAPGYDPCLGGGAGDGGGPGTASSARQRRQRRYRRLWTG